MRTNAVVRIAWAPGMPSRELGSKQSNIPRKRWLGAAADQLPLTPSPRPPQRCQARPGITLAAKVPCLSASRDVGRRLRAQMEEAKLNDIIDRLLEARNGRPGKQVHLVEAEIKQLCMTAREIFMAQPNLLELEAPIKICGAQQRPVLWVMPSQETGSTPSNSTHIKQGEFTMVGFPLSALRASCDALVKYEDVHTSCAIYVV
jgi:hypothetical protein